MRTDCNLLPAAQKPKRQTSVDGAMREERTRSQAQGLCGVGMAMALGLGRGVQHGTKMATDWTLWSILKSVDEVIVDVDRISDRGQARDVRHTQP